MVNAGLLLKTSRSLKIPWLVNTKRKTGRFIPCSSKDLLHCKAQFAAQHAVIFDCGSSLFLFLSVVWQGWYWT